MRSVFDEWKSYEREVVPKNATAIQREECRRAFYAGAWASFELVMAATYPTNEDDCDANLQALHDEMRAMVKDLRI